MTLLYPVFPSLEKLGAELVQSLLQTLQMVLISGIFAFFIGLALGILLVMSAPNGLWANRALHFVLSKIVDIVRSTPFLILMILLIPVSRAIVGTGSGVNGSYVALIVATVPFFARQIESVLSSVDKGLIEAGRSMGLSPTEIIFSIYLKESIPGITRATMITIVSLIGITAIAGTIGAGGLGDFAIRYGHHNNLRDMIWITVLIILALISLVQAVGKIIIKLTDHN